MKIHQTNVFQGGTRFVAGILLGLVLPIILSPSTAGAISWTIHQDDNLNLKEVQPYIYAVGGVQDPVADEYSSVFSGPLARYGGGFGIRMPYFGFEVLLRDGSSTESQTVQGVSRNFKLRVTELQARLYSTARFGRFSIPAGIGVGLAKITVDRGYPGIWDRFNGDGFNFSPFIAFEYRPVQSIGIGMEIEFLLSETEFSSSEAWHNQYYDSLKGTFPTSNSTEASFWDTVGGLNSETYNNGGLVISLRVVFNLPTYKEEGY